MASQGTFRLYNTGARRAKGGHSLYRGVVPPLLGVTPMFAVSFWVS